MGYTCAICGIEKNTLYRYSKHLRIFHEKLPNFRFTCDIDGCRDSFTVVRCFVRHASKKRGCLHVRATSDEVRTENDANESGDIDNNMHTDFLVDTSAGDSNCTRTSLDQRVLDFEKHLTLCVLKLRKTHFTSFCAARHN